MNTLGQLPVANGLHSLARYYQVHVLENVDNSACLMSTLEGIAESLPWQYKPRALCALAIRNLNQGNFAAAAEFYVEASKAAQGFDLLSQIQALRGFAILRSTLGDHRGALVALQHIAAAAWPLRSAYTGEYLECLNSVAMELAEVGRVGEANGVIDYVLGAGTVTGCLLPNWVDTKQEVLAKIGQPAPPLVFAFSRRLEEPQISAAAQIATEPVKNSASSSKKFFATRFAPNPALCLPTRHSNARLVGAKPRFLLPRETRPGSSHSPRAPPPAR